ncbi:hypothetical protein PL78_16800 [Yersinia entomophaga]|uniref:Uncharacterized protein n=1 Tax=Yersinia entomophaga TaxID=935293 RepID=A0ABM6BPG2_YERET|nr:MULTISPECIES: hypothetical protein [Yersinia]ANI31472.1 hypothetical protein PL78_16800 [Yersinia entomophaga]OWF90240.1 hypothetical protein B4914_01675 [Yersinia entomophaga]
MPKQILIKVSQEFSDFCKSNNFSLAAFRGASASNTNGVPVVWFNVANTNIVPNNPINVTFDPSYQVYDSLVDQVIPDGSVTVGQSMSAKLSDSFGIVAKQLTKLSGGGIPTGIRIINQTPGVNIVAGLAGDNGVPIAAFVCNPNVNLFLEPLQTVTISLIGSAFGVGTAIVKATGPSVLLDLTSNNVANIEYNVLMGEWDLSVGSPTVPLTQIPADTAMQPFVLPGMNSVKLKQLASLNAEAVK